MRTRLAAIIAAVVFLGGGLGLPQVAPEVQAAEPFNPDGRILVPGGGVYAGRRTCAPDCDISELTPSGQNDEGAAWSPTGRQVAFTRQVGENYLLHVLDITTGTITRVTSTQGLHTSDSDPDWSPDGSRIAFTHIWDSTDGIHTIQIGIVSLLGGEAVGVRHLTGLPNLDEYCKVFLPVQLDPSFSPDGQQIAYVQYSTNTVVFAQAPAAGPGIVLAAFGSEAGPRQAAAVCPSNQPTVFVSGVASHEGERVLAPSLGPTIGPAWSPDGASVAVVNKDGPWVAPVAGGAPIPIQDSTGNRPHPRVDTPGSFQRFHTGWDPGNEFLVVYPPDSGRPAVKYRPDGSGDLDTPAGTHATGGWSVQCVPSNCLTALTVRMRVDGAYGTYPATFHVSGTVAGDLTVDADRHEDSRFVRLKPGRASVTLGPNASWPLTAIQCDAPATVNLAARTVDLDIPLGYAVTCEFLSDIGVPQESGRPPDEGTTPAPSGDCSADTDRDGYCDRIENVYGSDPGDPASYPVTPPGYWDDHDPMGHVPARDCGTVITLNFCTAQAGDVLVWRFSEGVNSVIEGFFGNTYYTHALMVVGFWQVNARLNRVVPVIMDVTPHPDGRSELAMWNAGLLQWSAADRPDAAAIYRSAALSRSEREEAGRRGLEIAWELGADADNNHVLNTWNAPSGEYGTIGGVPDPGAWGPSAYYCASLVASAYGMSYADFKSGRPWIGSAAFFVTADDLLDGLPSMGKVMWFGQDGRGFAIHSPANLLLMDQAGHRTGRDVAGTTWDEIPGALWRLNPDDESVTAPGVTDAWTVTIAGTGDGPYHVDSHGVGDLAAGVRLLVGTTTTGATRTLTVAEFDAAAEVVRDGPARAPGSTTPPLVIGAAEATPGPAAGGAGTPSLPPVGLLLALVLAAAGALLLLRRRQAK